MTINTAEHWDKVWAQEGATTWRKYPECFSRIVRHVGFGKKILELGGGIGILAFRMQYPGNKVFLLDISPVAVLIAKTVFGIDGMAAALPPIPEEEIRERFGDPDCIVATEFLEHLEEPEAILYEASLLAPEGIYGVPDDCLGPEEEQEHHQKFTRETFKDLLSQFYTHVSVEQFTDAFYTGYVPETGYAGRIAIPTLLAVCRNE